MKTKPKGNSINCETARVTFLPCGVIDSCKEWHHSKVMAWIWRASEPCSRKRQFLSRTRCQMGPYVRTPNKVQLVKFLVFMAIHI